MRRLVINFIAVVIAFATGLTISHLLRPSAVEESIQPITTTNPIFVRPELQELPDLPREPDPAEGSDLSIDIQVSENDPNPPTYERRYIKLAKHGTTIVALDLGEYVDKSVVTLNFRDRSAGYRILQRYRTSMTINAEGPHLDLIDWRHFDSPWISLESLSPGRFQSVPANQMQDTRFPKTSKSEIVKEVGRQVGNDWPYLLKLVQSCNGPNEGACLIGISSIYLHIQKQVRGGWIDIGLVEFQLPMGC